MAGAGQNSVWVSDGACIVLPSSQLRSRGSEQQSTARRGWNSDSGLSDATVCHQHAVPLQMFLNI